MFSHPEWEKNGENGDCFTVRPDAMAVYRNPFVHAIGDKPGNDEMGLEKRKEPMETGYMFTKPRFPVEKTWIAKKS